MRSTIERLWAAWLVAFAARLDVREKGSPIIVDLKRGPFPNWPEKRQHLSQKIFAVGRGYAGYNRWVFSHRILHHQFLRKARATVGACVTRQHFSRNKSCFMALSGALPRTSTRCPVLSSSVSQKLSATVCPCKSVNQFLKENWRALATAGVC